MKRIKISLLLEKVVRCIAPTLAVVLLSTAAFAETVQQDGADKPKKKTVSAKVAQAKNATAAESFKRDFPTVPFVKIEESDIKGLYEVTVGANIVYYAPAVGKVIAGEMHDKTGRNITAEKKQALMAQQEAESVKQLATLKLDSAIKIGSGKNIVVLFTDIDCPYCRKVEEYFNSRTDLTRYVFLIPLEQIHPQARAKSLEVLCAKDPAAAFISAMNGGLDKAELKGCGDKTQDFDKVLAEHKAAAEKMGVTGTPIMWVNKKQVSGADTQKIEKYLLSGATGTVAHP
jgi:thiol:disulfide interchange protein DsbC